MTAGPSIAVGSSRSVAKALSCHSLLALLAAALLGGCAAMARDEPSGCQGPRRPANPHGSVLAPEAEPPSPTAAPAGGCGRAR